MAATGGGILVGKGQIALEAAVVTPGLAVLAIILFMGAVSGAHLNPAVSLAFALSAATSVEARARLPAAVKSQSL